MTLKVKCGYSGATGYMTNCKFILKNFVEKERDIFFADKEERKLISKAEVRYQ